MAIIAGNEYCNSNLPIGSVPSLSAFDMVAVVLKCVTLFYFLQRKSTMCSALSELMLWCFYPK